MILYLAGVIAKVNRCLTTAAWVDAETYIRRNKYIDSSAWGKQLPFDLERYTFGFTDSHNSNGEPRGET